MAETDHRDEDPGRPILLATKVRPPRPQVQTLLRERLLAKLQDGAGHKVTLVAAPAGFGKTTLLASWHELESARNPVGWLTVEERDNDPVVLWSYVIEALRHARPGFESTAKPEVVGSASILDAVLPRLINELDEQGDLTLILDDYHRLPRGATRDSVTWFIEHAPTSLHVVVSTRREPALNVAALRAHGELWEVRAEDLRFSSEEAEEFLNARLGLDLAPEDVGALVHRTEGWPAGLYLAALSAAGAKDRHTFVEEFGASNRHVVELLSREVIDTQTPRMRDLMLRSSILEHLNGSLCDALTGQEGSASMLDELARTNLFLFPLYDGRDWFRFHGLFAELLRVELERREPQLVPTLHRRASRWYYDHAMLDQAIEHAIAAGSFAEAAEIIEACWIVYVNDCKFASVLAWLALFPGEVLQADARLLLVKAWVLSISGKADDASRILPMVEAMGELGEGPLPDGLSSIGSSLTLLRAVFPSGDVSSQRANGLRAAELEGLDSPWRSVACWAVGAGSYYQGSLDEADRWLAEAYALAPASEQWVVAGSALAYRSLIAGDQGRGEEQQRLAEEATAFASEHDIVEIDGEIPVALGASLAASGQLEAALALLDDGLAVGRAWGQPIEVAHVLLRLIPVLRDLGHGRRAASALLEAREIVGGCPDPGVLRGWLAKVEPSAHHTVIEGDELSQKERRVLQFLSGSLTESEIGSELFLSRNTVHTHVRSIYRKLGASSRAEALQRARQLGLLHDAIT